MHIQFGLGLREKLSQYQGKDPLVQKYPGLEEMEKNYDMLNEVQNTVMCDF